MSKSIVTRRACAPKAAAHPAPVPRDPAVVEGVVTLLLEAQVIAHSLDVCRYAIIGAVHEANSVNAPTSDVLGFLGAPLHGLAELYSRARDLERRIETLGTTLRRFAVAR